jgi:hypothetical protein
MNVYEELQEGGTAPKAAKPDPVKEFKAMPSAERWLALFAVVVVVAYLLFGLTKAWYLQPFDVCALVGAVGVLVLVVPHLFGVRILSPRVRMYAFAAAGVLPAFGFVVQLLTGDFWHALMLAGGVAMGITAWQIAERERLIKK